MRKWAVLCVLGTVLTSCGGDSPTEPVGQSVYRPKTGSIYKMKQFSTDAMGSIIPNTDQISGYTVIQSDTTFWGKGGSWVLKSESSSERIVFSYGKELALTGTYQDRPTLPWCILPEAIGESSIDSVISDSSSRSYTRLVVTSKRIGVDNVSIGAEQVETWKYQLLMLYRTFYSTGEYRETVSEIVLWFAPSIGGLAKIDRKELQPSANGKTATLFYYLLR